MKGQTELSEFMLKLIAIILFTVFLVGGILSISQFKVQINENIGKRLAIDFGENILAAPCLTEEKGLFLESKINNEVAYRITHTEDKDGLSCLSASLMTAFKIKTEENEWFFGSSGLKSELEKKSSGFEFPAVIKLDGFGGDNFESGWDILDILDPAKHPALWYKISSGVSLSSVYSRSPSHSLKIDGSKKCEAALLGEVGCGISALLSEEKTGTVSLWFYDQNPAQNSEMYGYVEKDSNSFLAIGPDNPSDTGGKNYYYRDSTGYHETSIARNIGWHEFKWIFDGSKTQIFIDAEKIYETTSYGKFSKISLKSKKSGGADGYFDDIKIESSGKTVPAKLFVVVSTSNNCDNKNEGLNCYNCLGEEKCKKEGCKWEVGECMP